MLTLQKSRRGSGLIAKSSDSAGGLLPAPCICRGASALSAPLLAAWRLGPTSVSRSGMAKTSAMRHKDLCAFCALTMGWDGGASLPPPLSPPGGLFVFLALARIEP